MRSPISKWRRRQAAARQDRRLWRAVDAVSPGTLQDEVRAFAQTQFNR